jgi:hypothetical protein
MFEGTGSGSASEGAGEGECVPPAAAPCDGAETVRAILEEITAWVELLGECDPAALLSALAGRAPGPDTAALLHALDPDRLGRAELLDVLKARGAQLAHAEAGQLATIAAYAGRVRRDTGPGGCLGPIGTARPPAPEQVSEWASDDIAARLCLTRTKARTQLEHALDLTRRLPATLAALAAGRIDAHRAKVIAEGTRTLDDEQSAALEARVLPRAERQNPPQLRDSVRRAVLRADPAAAKDRHQRALTDRSVQVFPLEDGMAELVWRDRADRVLGFSAAVDALARAAQDSHGPEHAEDPEGGHRRSIQQCRADVMADLGVRLLNLDGLPTEHGARPNINVTVPLGTVLNLSQEPAELIGYGPIPAELARAIAAEGTWRRLLTDPASGALLDLGRERYRPPAALRDFVLARDMYCQGYGCRVPARRGDIDHRIDWAHGGHTRASDLDSLCRHTHRLKHEAGWTRERQPDGSTVWRTPTGHQYLRDPDWLPGARPPRGFTPQHQKTIREHAKILGITLPTEPDTENTPETKLEPPDDHNDPEPPPF